VYTPVANLSGILSALRNRHAQRVAQDPDFRELEEDIAELNQERSKRSISLNEAERRAERDAQEARFKTRAHDDPVASLADRPAADKSVPRDLTDLEDNGLETGEGELADERALAKRQKDAKDVRLIEAAHILGDEIDLQGPEGRLAARATP
jgi:carboxyl-terminal processing protease